MSLLRTDTPWCQNCLLFEPEYAKAARTLGGIQPEIVMAKIDVLKYEKLADEHEILSVPAIMVYIDGEAINYKGGPALYIYY